MLPLSHWCDRPEHEIELYCFEVEGIACDAAPASSSSSTSVPTRSRASRSTALRRCASAPGACRSRPARSHILLRAFKNVCTGCSYRHTTATQLTFVRGDEHCVSFYIKRQTGLVAARTHHFTTQTKAVLIERGFNRCCTGHIHGGDRRVEQVCGSGEATGADKVQRSVLSY